MLINDKSQLKRNVKQIGFQLALKSSKSLGWFDRLRQNKERWVDETANKAGGRRNRKRTVRLRMVTARKSTRTEDIKRWYTVSVQYTAVCRLICGVIVHLESTSPSITQPNDDLPGLGDGNTALGTAQPGRRSALKEPWRWRRTGSRTGQERCDVSSNRRIFLPQHVCTGKRRWVGSRGRAVTEGFRRSSFTPSPTRGHDHLVCWPLCS